MKPISRPSQTMIVLLLAAGGLIFLFGEGVLPKEGPRRAKHERELARAKRLDELRKKARTIAPGRNDMLDPARGEETLPEVPDSRSAIRTLVTLVGTVVPELRFPDGSRPEALAKEGDGQASESIPVSLELIWMGEGRPPGTGLRTGTIGEDGDYLMAGLRPGRYRLRAIPEDKTALNLPISVNLDIPELQPAEGTEAQPRFRQDLLLPLPRTMEGLLLSRTKGPLPGIRVSVSDAGMHRGSAVADERGRFKIEKVGPGPFDFDLLDDRGGSLPLHSQKVQGGEKGYVAASLETQ